jgi:twitching motility protein PilT
METLIHVLQAAASRGASDVHVKVGSAPVLRLDGRLERLSDPLVSDGLARTWLEGLLSPVQRDAFEHGAAVDMAYQLPEGERFRVAAFRQAGTPAFVFRHIREAVPPLSTLGLPPVVSDLCGERSGLILITGATGSGKSTTVAAMVDEINRNQARTIATIEDPVEFLHHDVQCHVTQREIGLDATDYGRALVEALRQDPDVLVIGEIRDQQTINTALIAAETGHLVLSTLHTTDAVETVQRVIMTYPEERQNATRVQLAAALRAVISQRLVARADGTGRVPAVEVLIATDRVRELITAPDGLLVIREVIAQGQTPYRMQTFDQSLAALLEDGRVTFEEAVSHATRPADFALRHRGVVTGKDEVRSSPFWRTSDRHK